MHYRRLEVQREMFQVADRDTVGMLVQCLQGSEGKTASHHMSTERNSVRAVEARGLLAQIDLKFVGILVTFTNVFDKISDTLQSSQLNLGTAVTLVDSLVNTLNSYREGSLFNEI